MDWESVLEAALRIWAGAAIVLALALTAALPALLIAGAVRFATWLAGCL